MTATEFREWLLRRDACEEGCEWAEGPTPQEVWEGCLHADLMVWALDQLGYSDARVLRLFAVWCTRQVWGFLTDPRSREVVDVAEKYAVGMAAQDELIAAARRAYEAIMDGCGNAARLSAAWAALYASFKDAAWAAFQASTWSAIAAEDTDWGAAFAVRLAQADELRRRIPWSAVEEFLRAQNAGEAQ